MNSNLDFITYEEDNKTYTSTIPLSNSFPRHALEISTAGARIGAKNYFVRNLEARLSVAQSSSKMSVCSGWRRAHYQSSNAYAPKLA